MSEEEPTEEFNSEELTVNTENTSAADPTKTTVFTGSGYPVTSGSIVSGSAGWTSIGSSPSYPPYTSTTLGPFTAGTAKKVVRKIVRLPSQFTDKVLIAFLDPSVPEEKNVVWAANLQPERIEIVSEDGEMKLHLTLSLEDVYGNLGEDSDED